MNPNPPYSIFIPCAPKDFGKLKFLIESVKTNLTGFDDIVVCIPLSTAMNLRDIGRNRAFDGVKYVDESDVLDMNISVFKHRPNWIYQQFLKLFQKVTKHDLYLTIDSDVVFNRPIPLFNEEGKKIWWRGWEQYHLPYYEFNSEFGLFRKFEGTFLCDMNFFDRRIIDVMLHRFEGNMWDFIERSAAIIDSECYPSEADLYGQFFYTFCPDAYEIRQAKTKALAREMSDKPWEHRAWSDEDIQKKLNEAKEEDVDIIALHSWFTSNEVQK